MFFEDNQGRCYPVSRISKVPGGRWSRAPAERKGWRGFGVTLDDGEIVYVDAHERDRIFAGSPSQIWPAQPGTYLISCEPEFPPQTVESIWPTPVIAWAWTNDGVQPVTADGLNDGLDQSATILFPDGNVTAPEDRSWKSLADWLRTQQEHAAAIKERPE